MYVSKKDTKGLEKIQISSCSIKYDGIPPQSGVVRGWNSMSGALFEELVSNESEQKSEENEQVWTKMTYMVQVDLKGWLTSGVVDLAMSGSTVATFDDFRTYLRQL